MSLDAYGAIQVDGNRLTPTLNVEADANARQMWLTHRGALDLTATNFAVPFALIKEWTAHIMQAETTVDRALWEQSVGVVEGKYDPELAPAGLRFKEAAWKNLFREVKEERMREQARQQQDVRPERRDPLAP